MRRWDGKALEFEVVRLNSAKLTAKQIAQVMGISEGQVKRAKSNQDVVKQKLDSYEESQHRSELNYQLRQAKMDARPVTPVPFGFERRGMGAYDYARRVLELTGELPKVSRTPGDIVRLANGVLKGMELEQISDRAEWLV